MATGGCRIFLEMQSTIETGTICNHKGYI